MDNVSISKANSLYWLGRYVERAYTLSKQVMRFHDRMVDSDTQAYKEFCANLGIVAEFEHKNDFLKRIVANKNCKQSIAFSLNEGYNNAIILREQINTETVAYVQLALNCVLRNFNDYCRMDELQKVMDYLMSFWGAIDDFIIEDEIRDAIKAGKYIERIDLLERFGIDSYYIDGCKRRLIRYITHLDDTDICCSDLKELIYDEDTKAYNIEVCVSRLLG